MVSPMKKRAIWLLYLPIALILIFLIINLFMQGELFTVSYIFLLILGVLVSMWPIRTEEKYFSLETGVSIVTLVVFGVVHEILLSSVAVILMMRRLNIERDQHYRYPLNLFALSVQSLISAAGYYIVQNFLVDIPAWPRLIIALIVYFVIHSFSNNLGVLLATKYFYGIKKTPYSRKNLIFSIRINSISLFIALIFLYLYDTYGFWGQLVGTLPFIAVTVNLNYYYRAKRHNNYLSEVNHHVAKMTENMNRKDVIHSFITSLLEIFPIDKIYYFKVNDDYTIESKRIYYNKKMYDHLAKDAMDSNYLFLQKTLMYNKISVYHRGEEWLSEDLINDHSILAESAITIPVQILGNVRGIILLVNEQRSAFTEFIVSLIEVFYQYFTNVLRNADQYEKLEVSLGTDELTQLANFRSFSEKIKHVNEKNNFETLSIIILDLDFFKKVNDTHGHNAGNEVLVQLAEVLKEFERKDRFISRYGGEEFILLLENHSKEVAYQLAEEIRTAIADRIYYVNQSIVETEEIEVQMTASFGVATYPDDTTDIYKLVLLADGVMYKKSKQTGRNKVSVFVK